MFRGLFAGLVRLSCANFRDPKENIPVSEGVPIRDDKQLVHEWRRPPIPAEDHAGQNEKTISSMNNTGART